MNRQSTDSRTVCTKKILSSPFPCFAFYRTCIIPPVELETKHQSRRCRATSRFGHSRCASSFGETASSNAVFIPLIGSYVLCVCNSGVQSHFETIQNPTLLPLHISLISADATLLRRQITNPNRTPVSSSIRSSTNSEPIRTVTRITSVAVSSWITTTWQGVISSKPLTWGLLSLPEVKMISTCQS
jgi:hypothetical protein